MLQGFASVRGKEQSLRAERRAADRRREQGGQLSGREAGRPSRCQTLGAPPMSPDPRASRPRGRAKSATVVALALTSYGLQ
jgi:hypothetical protein